MADDCSTPATTDRPFHVTTQPNGPACTLECDYCFSLEKAERSEFRMSEGPLETYVRQPIEAQPGPVVTFAWQGGEPTPLGLEFFRRGNLHETHLAHLVDSPGQRQFGAYKRDGLPDRCRDCDVRGLVQRRLPEELAPRDARRRPRPQL